MCQTAGMLTLDELTTLVGAGEIETVLMVFTDLYGRFMGKRFSAGFFLEQAAEHGSYFFLSFSKSSRAVSAALVLG